MPHYGHAGPGKLRRLDAPRAETPEVSEPERPNAPGTGDETEKRFVCTAPHPDRNGDQCGRKFKKAMIMARHFNSSHENLREDKDSWREFYEEVWE